MTWAITCLIACLTAGAAWLWNAARRSARHEVNLQQAENSLEAVNERESVENRAALLPASDIRSRMRKQTKR